MDFIMFKIISYVVKMNPEKKLKLILASLKDQ